MYVRIDIIVYTESEMIVPSLQLKMRRSALRLPWRTWGQGYIPQSQELPETAKAHKKAKHTCIIVVGDRVDHYSTLWSNTKLSHLWSCY